MNTSLSLSTWLVAAGAVLALVVLGRAARRAPLAVVVATVAAVACTAYSGDTAWRFAGHRLGMVDTTERAAFFAAGEVALFACALMARQNLQTTGVPGTPGVLVWFITGVQVIPAYSESGIVGGTVRAVVGPVMAALLWHLALGVELRHRKPGAVSQSLPAVLAREARERLLSRLGLAVRGRDAAQIGRDRATERAVRLAARLAVRPEGSWRSRLAGGRLAAAVARAGVGEDDAQRRKLLQQLTARRTAGTLATVAVVAPWDVLAVPAPAVPAAERVRPAPRTRTRAVPAAPGTPDPLLSRVRTEYADGHPTVRELKARYSIGQKRAQSLREGLAAAS